MPFCAMMQGPPYKHPSMDAPRCLPCHFDYPPGKLKLFTGPILCELPTDMDALSRESRTAPCSDI